jgi:hypothetical protein
MQSQVLVSEGVLLSDFVHAVNKAIEKIKAATIHAGAMVCFFIKFILVIK